MQLKRIFLTLGIVIYLVVLLILWLIRQQQNASWWIPAIAAYVVSLVVLVMWWVPKLQASSLSAKGVDAEAVFKAENDARATLAQILGGFAVLIGLYFAWKNITEMAESLKLT